ncbi:acetyl coenzyme A:deacetylcephalosporin C o-acetyltransferase [Xylariomycetidae sp. FL2044]|nr:acetyl coenzyme A:deacetylcephalosporin C o-acetyltransferase [Xylariomycetidae sp. FL2044]
MATNIPLGVITDSIGRHHSTPRWLPSQLYASVNEFTLESGEVLANATVAFTVKGRLNQFRTNAIVICHALSGSADVGDWWSNIFSLPSAALDLNKFCIICCNSLGSPYGSSSPLTRKPGSTSFYGSSFPKTTIRDDVRIHRHVLDILGVQSVHCVIGASMGGMLALEWALLYGERYVRSLVLVATAASQSAWAMGWSENQRATIMADARYRDGNYGDDPPLAGLAAARMAAMLSYRTHQSFEKRFGRRRAGARSTLLARANSSCPARAIGSGGRSTSAEEDGDGGSESHRDETTTFLSQSYMRYQGDKFNARFDANCYLHILDKIDTHDVSRWRFPAHSDAEALREALAEIRQPALVVGIPTDGLYPYREQTALAERMPHAHFATLHSEEGHDGFLLEGEQMNRLLRGFLDKLPLLFEEESLGAGQDQKVANIVATKELELHAM